MTILERLENFYSLGPTLHNLLELLRISRQLAPFTFWQIINQKLIIVFLKKPSKTVDKIIINHI